MNDRHEATRELTRLLQPECQTCGGYGYTHYDKRLRPVPCRVCQPRQKAA
jgi:hypothetical protein